MQPYKNEGINQIYELLFCDDIDLYRGGANATDYPWDVLFADVPDIEELTHVLHDSELETRPKILAARLLEENAVVEPSRRLMGVVVEAGLEDGLDVLAAYEDGTARYINFSGKVVVWDTQTVESEAVINELFDAGTAVVNNIGAWDGPRRPAPASGNIRLNFLVSDGLYFGEGPFDVLQADPMGGPVIAAAVKLMSYLIHQAEPVEQ
jgi:hypothetical protein